MNSNVRDNGDLITFEVTSNGLKGWEWIESSEERGINLGYYAKQVLCSSDFRPTNGITTEVTVVKRIPSYGNGAFTDSMVSTIEELKLDRLSVEVACLAREMFTDDDIEEMGIHRLFIMHEPVTIPIVIPKLLLCINTSLKGNWLEAHFSEHNLPLEKVVKNHPSGFAFSRGNNA